MWEDLLDRVEKRIEQLVNELCGMLESAGKISQREVINLRLQPLTPNSPLTDPYLSYFVGKKKRRKFVKKQKQLKALLKNRDIILMRIEEGRGENSGSVDWEGSS